MFFPHVVDNINFLWLCPQAIEKLIVLIFFNVHVTDTEKSDSLMKAS